MRLARVRTSDGIVRGEYQDGVVDADGASYTVGDDAELVAPSDPSVFYCVGRNYAAYLEEHDLEKPDHMHFFLKPPVSAVDPEADIPYPTFSNELGYAGELAAVIGERCKHVAPEDVPDVVEGYTIMNDVDVKDQPETIMIKAFDGSAPFGPWIETDVDPIGIDMRTTINGEVRQEANTGDMMFHPPGVISEFSERFTLQPGDVIAFGSPANPGLIEPGDEIEIWYEGIGTLRNTVGPRP